MRYFISRAVIAVAVFIGPSSAALPELSAKDVQAFIQPHLQRNVTLERAHVADWHPILLVKWENDARAALGDNDVPHAAQLLAGKYGLPVDTMAQLLKLWVLADAHEFPRGKPGDDALGEMNLAWIDFAAASGYKPLILQAMTSALGRGDRLYACDPKLLDRLLEKAADRVGTGWPVVEQRQCRDWQVWFLDHAGQQTFAPLVEATRDNNLPAVHKLAILDWLTSEAGLKHVEPQDRVTVRLQLTREYAMGLWRQGLAEGGVAVVEALPPEVREALLAGDLKPQTVHADGLEFALEGAEAERFRLEYAAALLEADRPKEAATIFARASSLRPAQKYLTCHPTEAQMTWGDPCGDPNRNFAAALLLDAAQGNTGKLGDIAQAFFSNEWLVPEGVLWTAISCRVFNPRFAQACTMMKKMWPPTLDDETVAPKDVAATAAVRAIPSFTAKTAQFRRSLAVIRHKFAPTPTEADADACAFFTPNFMSGKPFTWGPGRPGKPISYRDPRSGISFYVESDGRHLAALSSDGVLLWVRNPFEDSKMCPYRNGRPIIVAIEPSDPAGDDELTRIFKRKTRGLFLRFDSSQFGAVDIDTGDFVFMGQN